jgi:hypothetical protein
MKEHPSLFTTYFSLLLVSVKGKQKEDFSLNNSYFNDKNALDPLKSTTKMVKMNTTISYNLR